MSLRSFVRKNFSLNSRERPVVYVLIIAFLAGSALLLTSRYTQYQLEHSLYDYSREDSVFFAKTGLINRPALLDSAQYTIINSLTVSELMTIKGIGEVLGERIVSFRKQKGPIKSKEDLLSIPGIGTVRTEAIMEYIERRRAR
ncbi:ComEA family DNA-binding protein [candidate division KSB1 bacterium]